jgi:GNAT superfamily N-acetyltransferase
MWIPPDGTEFTPEQEAALVAAMDELLGTEAGRVNETFEEFEKAHPRNIPHFYLSLLGTHPDHVGHGYGLTLLAENLAAIDDAGYPAYLEASHPGNVPIYQRFGFEPLAKFQGPNGGPVITGMWRPSQGPITVAVNS